jgi:pyrroline-5-carboxylate reductase
MYGARNNVGNLGNMTRIAFIGGGNMARSLIGGLLKTGVPAANLRVAEPQPQAREALGRDFRVATYTDNRLAVEDADVIVLAVKPQVMPAIYNEMRDTLQRNRPLLISIAAGVRLDQLERWFGVLPIVRCMPNTPALIGAGATGLCANLRVTPQQREQAQHILDAVGLTRWIADEALMDTVTAISGSGPAYFFALVEALEDAAVAQGMPREAARILASQTCLGAGRMLVESNESPAVLRQRVTSPNGTTQAALESFSADQLPRIVARAVAAATRRGQELAAALDKE